MKRTLSFLITAMLGCVLVGVAAAQSQNQSLGDYARAVKKTKPASSKSTPKVFDNDNLPSGGTLSVVGNPADSDSAEKDKDQEKTADSKTADAKSADAPKTETKAGDKDKTDKKDEAQLKPGQPTQERDKALEAVQHKLDAQKEKIALLSRELDVLQREYQLKVATFYSDPAKRVENPNGLFDDESKYKDQIAEKQKALEDANTELSDMQDEARRAGAPSSVVEQ